MDNLKEKSALLTDSGFYFDINRELFINKSQQKIMSIEFVEDHSQKEIERLIERSDSRGWNFYFNAPPPESVKSQILEDVQR